MFLLNKIRINLSLFGLCHHGAGGDVDDDLLLRVVNRRRDATVFCRTVLQRNAPRLPVDVDDAERRIGDKAAIAKWTHAEGVITPVPARF